MMSVINIRISTSIVFNKPVNISQTKVLLNREWFHFKFPNPCTDNGKMKDVEKPDYLLTVANRYLALKGTAMVTSLDIAQILDWETRGIPLGAALAGIERAFGSLAPGRPHGLSTCLPYVSKAIPEFAPSVSSPEISHPPVYDPEAEIKQREEMWEGSTEEAKNRALMMARAILQHDITRMERLVIAETVLNLAKRILASREE
jgi:hypothetical protein